MTEVVEWMARALALAQQGVGFVSPNPAVGAVVVQGDRCVGEGYHQHVGQPHAEQMALTAAGEQARGATLYVTLEPCNHYGRTPPCTEAIIAAGIRHVYYATPDTNPHVAGAGHTRLTQAGVTVSAGLLDNEARQLNRFYFYAQEHDRPYVIAKFAMSLDGKIATRTGDTRWISSPESRAYSHQMRQQCDAILVGADTVIGDNPQLTVRLPELVTARHPLRVVLDSHGRVPTTARLFDPELPGETVVATTVAMSDENQDLLRQRGVGVWLLPQTAVGQVDLSALLARLHKSEIQSLLVEGGGTVLGSFFEKGLVQEVAAFIAPLIIGGDDAPNAIRGQGAATLAEAWRLGDVRWRSLGVDFLLEGVIA